MLLLLKLDTGRAPSLRGHYPASPLLWAHPTPEHARPGGYGFPPDALGHDPRPARASQVPSFICPHAPPPLTPESPATACIRCLIAGARPKTSEYPRRLKLTAARVQRRRDCPSRPVFRSPPSVRLVPSRTASLSWGSWSRLIGASVPRRQVLLVNTAADTATHPPPAGTRAATDSRPAAGRPPAGPDARSDRAHARTRSGSA
jgi:hypothetical protein